MIFHLGPYVLDMSRLAAGGTLLDALALGAGAGEPSS